MTKQPKITKATRQAFIGAFCELCKTTPIEKITVQELTKKAGYNRCTFYEYFNNVYDLLESIEDELISRIKANLFETLKSVDASEQFIATVVNLFKGQEKYFDVLFSNSHISNFAERLKSVMFPAFMTQFNISKKDAKSRYVLEFHLSGLIGIMTRWIINKRDISIQQLIDVVREVFSEGVLKILRKNPEINLICC